VKKFALTGISITHSKSPQLFAAGYPHSNDCTYGLLPAATAEEAIRLFHANGLSGMNVTTPFKNDILHYVDEQSEEVRRIGAANVVLLRNGKLLACNTDTAGVTGALEAYGWPAQNRNALVLGAGGAGQAAVYALKQAGAHVYWANRTMEKIENRAAQYAVVALPLCALSERLHEIHLIVNTLPATAEVLSTLPWRASHVLFDADYQSRPLEQPAAAARAQYISGLMWLLWQAVPSFRLFTGKPPDVAAMKTVLRLKS
jgi:shikimate dehydrogenase